MLLYFCIQNCELLFIKRFLYRVSILLKDGMTARLDWIEMKFLITNDGNFRNKGNEAIAKSIVNGISSITADASFEIFTNDPVYARYVTENKKVSFLTQPFRIWHPFTRWWHYIIISKLGFSASVKRAMDAFRNADVVLSTAGDNFSSTSSNLHMHIGFIKTAVAFKKPVFLIGCSVDPFTNKRKYKSFCEAARNIRLVTARESISFKYLQSMNLGDARIELAADPAFCLEPNMEKIQKILGAYHISDEKPIVGIAPSQAITYYTKLPYVAHFKVLQNLIEFLMKELRYHVVLIPHVREVSVKGNDDVICEKLYRNLNFPKDMSIISLDHSAEEIRALMSKLDLLVAERMHAAIAGLAQQVPTFVIGYSIKAEGILGDIFGFENLMDYMVPINKLNEETLETCVKNLIDKKDEVNKYLSKRIRHIKNSAKDNFVLIMDILRSGNIED